MRGYIYFLQMDLVKHGCHQGPVKVGFSKKPDDRFDDISSHLPFNINMLLVIRGTIKEEKRIHKAFIRHLMRHEWYYPTQELMSFIEHLRAIQNTLDPENLPIPQRTIFRS